MFDDFDLGPQSDEYSDSDRLDEMLTADDYNRWEEEQVFQDREWEQDEFPPEDDYAEFGEE